MGICQALAHDSHPPDFSRPFQFVERQSRESTFLPERISTFLDLPPTASDYDGKHLPNQPGRSLDADAAAEQGPEQTLRCCQEAEPSLTVGRYSQVCLALVAGLDG